METLREYWAVITGAVTLIGGFAVWLIRLEARSISNAEAIRKEAAARERELAVLEARLIRQREEDREDRAREWRDIKDQLAAMQSAMQDSINSLRADIRCLLKGD